MHADPGDAYAQRVLRNGIDHLVRAMVLNADTEHAGKLFLQACDRRGVLDGDSEEMRQVFLSRLLPELERLERLPPLLVPFMIRRFGWPDSVQSIDADTDLPAEVCALLQRHARENWITRDGATLVVARVDGILRRRTLLAVLGGLILLLAAIAGKILIRVLN